VAPAHNQPSCEVADAEAIAGFMATSAIVPTLRVPDALPGRLTQRSSVDYHGGAVRHWIAHDHHHERHT
jgi:hypothetical protein